MRTRIALAALGAVTLLLAPVACSKDITATEQLPPLVPASTDAGSGDWKMIVLTSPSQIAVAVPVAVTSDAYKAEVISIKASQAALTDAQRANIAYWAGGGVLRWNQILRGLVAKYNLPSAPRADGSYPLPDANNPFADPNFPFANPPYAARAYSYVSVAQYEALKSAWYWKYQFKRAAPTKVDATVQALVPVSDLPSYPSEDATLSGVTAGMLQLLFPAAVEEITRRAADQREAALLSGKATASDIAAGLALGSAVATIVTARARTDGTGNAVGNAALWKALTDSATSRGETPWISQESPARPPMLPNFGLVQAWNMTISDIVAVRPPAPPSTSSKQMQTELAEVKLTVAHLSAAQRNIAQKWNDGAGTYTPPGHWNDIAAEYVRDANMSEVRAARAFALLNMAMHDASVACWNTKYIYFNPRPAQLDPTIKTAIGLPNFPAYPSGHSTFSASAAAVLSYLFPSGASDFNAQADEAGISRLYGGIHYRSDIDRGKEHGTRIGGFTVRFAQQDRAN